MMKCRKKRMERRREGKKRLESRGRSRSACSHGRPPLQLASEQHGNSVEWHEGVSGVSCLRYKQFIGTRLEHSVE